MVHRSRWLGLLIAVLILTGSLTPPLRLALELPDQLTVPAGQVAQLHLGLPMSVHVRAERPGIVALAGSETGRLAAGVSVEPLAIRSLAPGRVEIDLRLFGVIPFRTVTVDVVPPLTVMPGGQSIGVVIRSEGVRVVAHAAVTDRQGRRHYPARDAGVRVGDVILRLNGRPVESVERVADDVHLAGTQRREVTLELRRDGRRVTTSVRPVYDRDQRRYLIGVWLRDATTGVGTLTYYHPESGTFGALGHPVIDGDTGQLVDVGRGRIVPAAVLDVNRGIQGRPGEKVGTFSPDAPTLGEIERNTPHGISGRLAVEMKHPLYDRPLPVAFASQVQPGPAEILTVVHGEEMGRYRVEIERVLGSHEGGKNLIVHITDPRLLAATGGIVQGMSGSPIIQQGHIVGAVTHVFVNDPTRGYGILIEWMLRDAGLLEWAELKEAS